ncbi:MAG TPA: hypothetical protein VGV41_12445 [Pseudolabrys sp.]|uniref:hypothetical protein n=1 Tax=Pseudolabrys sp. TaxID=1960880 RepID=UPI002DDD91E0|nr:hypothetical protein [Pseudolabrys sp.]HEV2629440.1 hypothetical protein [Pseudolabrys sp.]
MEIRELVDGATYLLAEGGAAQARVDRQGYWWLRIPSTAYTHRGPVPIVVADGPMAAEHCRQKIACRLKQTA